MTPEAEADRLAGARVPGDREQPVRALARRPAGRPRAPVLVVEDGLARVRGSEGQRGVGQRAQADGAQQRPLVRPDAPDGAGGHASRRTTNPRSLSVSRSSSKAA